MTEIFKYSKRTLSEVATEIASELYEQIDVPSVFFWEYPECADTYTQGWMVEIGGFESKNIRMQIWLDSYTQIGGMRFYAGFYSNRRKPLLLLKETMPKPWASKCKITTQDVSYAGSTRLKKPLDSKLFGKAIYEAHAKETFLGFYDPIDPQDDISRQRFARHAVNFFRDMIWAYCPREVVQVLADDYRNEEKLVVRTHLAHDRDQKMALRCKERDGYQCQVCGFVFEDMYGKVGERYAESHHKTPLSKLETGSVTRVDDLITVCANCHRMLHRMGGQC